jgi:hypothetical protein
MLPSSVRASTETMIMPFQKYSIYAASDAKLTLRGVITMREKAAEPPRKRPFLSVILDNDDETNTAVPDKRRCLSDSPDKRAAIKRVHFSRDLVSCIVQDTTGDHCNDALRHDAHDDHQATTTWCSEDDYVQFQLACRETVHLAQSSLQRTGDWSLDLQSDQHTVLGLEQFLSTDREQARLERVRHHGRTMLHKVNRRQRRLHRRNCATQSTLAEVIRCIPLNFSL